MEAATLDKTLVPVYGVVTGSPFEQIRSFHVITDLPPDLMHDVLEGVIPITLDVIAEKVDLL